MHLRSASSRAPRLSAGIVELMNDLGAALARGGDDVCMLGGGNPSRIPAMEAVWRRCLDELLRDGDRFERAVGHYDPPQGPEEFRELMAAALRKRCGWPLTARNIAVTQGSQSAFFFLVHLFAGQSGRVLLPMAPEYIGYADLGLGGASFVCGRPYAVPTGPRSFRYRIECEALPWSDDVAAVLLSRPTNPTGNVVDDGELRRLATLAAERSAPLIVDGAYGPPFPDIVFREARPWWDENVVLTLSLSKLGLPGLRCGLVVAREEIAAEVAAFNAVASLASGGFGPALVTPLLRSGELFALCRDVIRPFYERKARLARQCLEESLPPDMDWRLHEHYGGFFLWLWFPGLPIPSWELYERLKARGVLVVSGYRFFHGNAASRPEARECLRVTFAQSDDVVARGLRVLGDELRRAAIGR